MNKTHATCANVDRGGEVGSPCRECYGDDLHPNWTSAPRPLQVGDRVRVNESHTSPVFHGVTGIIHPPHKTSPCDGEWLHVAFDGEEPDGRQFLPQHLTRLEAEEPAFKPGNRVTVGDNGPATVIGTSKLFATGWLLVDFDTAPDLPQTGSQRDVAASCCTLIAEEPEVETEEHDWDMYDIVQTLSRAWVGTCQCKRCGVTLETSPGAAVAMAEAVEACKKACPPCEPQPVKTIELTATITATDCTMEPPKPDPSTVMDTDRDCCQGCAYDSGDGEMMETKLCGECSGRWYGATVGDKFTTMAEAAGPCVRDCPFAGRNNDLCATCPDRPGYHPLPWDGRQRVAEGWTVGMRCGSTRPVWTKK